MKALKCDTCGKLYEKSTQIKRYMIGKKSGN